MSFKRWVACDIDHTLRASWWRDGLIPPPGSWDDYHADQGKDPPIEEMIRMVRALFGGGFSIIGLSAIPEKWRQATTRWLSDHDVPMDELLLRPHEDFRPSPQLKMGMLQKRFPGLAGVELVIEDREDVAAAFVEQNVTVLIVRARRPR